ncbi:hypothetical protein GTPT_3327 [Tatumella ptyseos ATCC 33301]|uniref:Uncharacterized protein n=1 Tax=Tatumella ptyseos ATCC 33301 TaxID=1005995 RepID=A0A085J9A7_9GAMM|nr:hypothetical protein GTPT_3327 [Tatumella ptyseos ATCC 33301]
MIFLLPLFLSRTPCNVKRKPDFDAPVAKGREQEIRSGS